MSPPWRRTAGRVGNRREHGPNWITAWRWGGRGRAIWQAIELDELRRFDRLQAEMPVGQALDPTRSIKSCPFGTQCRDGAALTAQLGPQFGNAFGLKRGIELDLVYEGCRQNERAYDQ